MHDTQCFHGFSESLCPANYQAGYKCLKFPEYLSSGSWMKFHPWHENVSWRLRKITSCKLSSRLLPSNVYMVSFLWPMSKVSLMTDINFSQILRKVTSCIRSSGLLQRYTKAKLLLTVNTYMQQSLCWQSTDTCNKAFVDSQQIHATKPLLTVKGYMRQSLCWQSTHTCNKAFVDSQHTDAKRLSAGKQRLKTHLWDRI